MRGCRATEDLIVVSFFIGFNCPWSEQPFVRGEVKAVFVLNAQHNICRL
jgi:hypothetical protein